ncbi:roadblock/LC7 domain-containing protein [Kitasatospora cystarginea]|uniref:Roadblock/LC7 domain-containing protein n=1 Tax=Kitasatospora cystarginea TaxID=58350 RepID=A0ABP5RE77_9ACTN
MTRGVPLAADVSPFADRLAAVAGVTAVVCLSADGLPLGASMGLPDAARDRTAAMVCSLLSAAGSSSLAISQDECGRPAVGQVTVEFDRGYLIVMPAGENSTLAVLTAPDADLGVVAYEIARNIATFSTRAYDAPARTAAP